MNIFKRVKSFFKKSSKGTITTVTYKPDITCKIVKSLYNIDQKVGFNFSTFFLTIDKNIFVKYDVIESEIGILCRVINIFKTDNRVEVEVKIETNIPEHYCPAIELMVGKQWRLKQRI